MKYLKDFETNAEFEAYYTGSEYEEPFVGVVEETNSVKYNQRIYSNE